MRKTTGIPKMKSKHLENFYQDANKAVKTLALLITKDFLLVLIQILIKQEILLISFYKLLKLLDNFR